jgi:hypothetical protein
MKADSERAGEAQEGSGRAPMEAIAEVADILRRRRAAATAEHEARAQGETEAEETRTEGGRAA